MSKDMVTFTRSIFDFKNKHLPRKTTFSLKSGDIPPDLYVVLMEKLFGQLESWLVYESSISTDYTNNKLLSMLSNTNIPAAIDPRSKFHEDFILSLQDNSLNNIHSKLINLTITLKYEYPTEFIELLQGKIYHSLIQISDLNYPTPLMIYGFIHRYPFLWLLFPLQNVFNQKIKSIH